VTVNVKSPDHTWVDKYFFDLLELQWNYKWTHESWFFWVHIVISIAFNIIGPDKGHDMSTLP